jgi:hypothetical protein
MANRIPQEDLTTLQDVATVQSAASTAKAELEEMSVAHLINEAANCGEYSAVCSRLISKELITKLKGMGYTITEPAPIAKPGDVSIISWKPE